MLAYLDPRVERVCDVAEQPGRAVEGYGGSLIVCVVLDFRVSATKVQTCDVIDCVQGKIAEAKPMYLSPTEGVSHQHEGARSATSKNEKIVRLAYKARLGLK